MAFAGWALLRQKQKAVTVKPIGLTSAQRAELIRKIRNLPKVKTRVGWGKYEIKQPAFSGWYLKDLPDGLLKEMATGKVADKNKWRTVWIQDIFQDNIYTVGYCRTHNLPPTCHVPKRSRGIGKLVSKATRAVKKVHKVTTKADERIRAVAQKEIKKSLKPVRKLIKVTSAPLVKIESKVSGQIAKALPQRWRKYIISPAEAVSMLQQPKDIVNLAYDGLKDTAIRPLYKLTAETFGPKAAAAIMPVIMKPEDVGITPGTQAAHDFHRNQRKGRHVAISVASLFIPAVAVAYAVYSTATGVHEQEKAKKLMNERMAQEEARFAIEEAKKQAEIAGQSERLEVLRAQMKALNAQTAQTEGAINEMAKGHPDIKPKGKNIALTIGAGGAAILALTTLT